MFANKLHKILVLIRSFSNLLCCFGLKLNHKNLNHTKSQKTISIDLRKKYNVTKTLPRVRSIIEGTLTPLTNYIYTRNFQKLNNKGTFRMVKRMFPPSDNIK